MKSVRRKLMIGFGVAALLLSVSSAAWACTIWVGQFTVDNTSGADYNRVDTYGLGIGMNHCAMKGAVQVHMGNATHPPSSIELTYKPLPSGAARPVGCAAAGITVPADGTYTISYLNTGFGEFVGGNTDWSIDQGEVLREYKADCMAVGGHRSTWNDANDELVVSGGSAGPKSVTIDRKPSTINSGNEIPDLPGTESAICIQQKAGTYSGAPHGGQAPVIVI